MFGAEHSNAVLYLQSDALHAPTVPVMSATPPFFETFKNVSHAGWLESPTVIAIA